MTATTELHHSADRRRPNLGAALLLAGLLAFGTGACADQQDDDQPAAAGPAEAGAQTLVENSADATRKLTSAHVVITTTGKIQRLGPVTKVDADVQASPLIANGEVTYDNDATAPFVLADGFVSVRQGGRWNEVGATSTFVPPSVIDPSQGLPKLLDGITGVKQDGRQDVDGVATSKVVGKMPADKLKDLLPEADSAADFTAWIGDGADPVLVKAVINISADQSLTVALSNWNAPVQVTKAPVA